MKKRGSKKSARRGSAKTEGQGKTGRKNGHKKNGKEHPIFHQHLTRGQKAADLIARFGGSWVFITLFFLFLVAWVAVNSIMLAQKPFDPYPYILLNLFLSCLAAIQAPIILMAQNRQAERDRIDAKYDHQVNRKAEREIQAVQKELRSIRDAVVRLRRK
ncbi:cyclic nucleotide-binding protein [Candidatus Woesearchaeota archaeon CG10_big_fil_rev_8_21_14_0_10_45_16]|nr:MAG: cyclic nucleotide-binding protein [Candidatus Woesearchaeota archaeon CG10_big_fil_rev_8_21_14_0_10_45_16]